MACGHMNWHAKYGNAYVTRKPELLIVHRVEAMYTSTPTHLDSSVYYEL